MFWHNKKAPPEGRGLFRVRSRELLRINHLADLCGSLIQAFDLLAIIQACFDNVAAEISAFDLLSRNVLAVRTHKVEGGGVKK